MAATILPQNVGLPTTPGYYFIKKPLDTNYMYLLHVRGIAPFLDIDSFIILPHRINNANNDSPEYINANLNSYSWSGELQLESLPAV
jgi:hypothetical protein